MDEKVVPFKSPKSLEVEIPLLHGKPVTGMGVKAGITLIVGGGFHGKSTLLQALEVGVYNHIPGDGREFVSSVNTAVKIRAEDGRSVACVDISPFINNLPQGRPTHNFKTKDASGSTSQAANILEAMELGATALFLDEDTCATNFMIRDRRMRMLVSSSKEPITPFISKIKSLYDDLKTSSILVIGGSGDYFTVADTVIMMDSYVPVDVTGKAKEIVKQQARTDGEDEQVNIEFGKIRERAVNSASIERLGSRTKTLSLTKAAVGDTDLDLSGLEQLVEVSQTRCITDLIVHAMPRLLRNGATLRNAIDALEKEFDNLGSTKRVSGLDCAGQWEAGSYSRPRRFEIAAALNRLRDVEFKMSATGGGAANSERDAWGK